MGALPVNKKNIVIIGAGSIVQHAHLPAYKIAGFSVAGIFDINSQKAQHLAHQFSITKVYDSLDEALNQLADEVIFDIAVPPDDLKNILTMLPNNCTVLMQKPMGKTLKEASAIVQLCNDKKLVACVNLQLRFAPFIVMARQMIQQGLIGKLCDIEVNVNVHTPWQIWDFLANVPRLEILYHSIHYIDLIRSFLDNPTSVYAKTVRHPSLENLTAVKSNIIMDYGENIRANILTNHCHNFGLQHQQSYIKMEGTNGAIKITMGLLMNYPEGVPDVFEYFLKEGPDAGKWLSKPVEGSWFPHAFIGSMNEAMKAAMDKTYLPDNNVADCLKTMACVEAAYDSSEAGGVKPYL